MRSLRAKLIAAFIIATLMPLGATIWITTSLLERSLGYATTEELDRQSRTLEGTVRQFYQRERDSLKREALDGRVAPTSYAVANLSAWPEEVRAFWESGETGALRVSPAPAATISTSCARARTALMSTAATSVVSGCRTLSEEFRRTRQLVGSLESRDLRRGFTLTLLLLVALVWIVSLAPILFIAHRVSNPIRQLTAGLTGFAGGPMGSPARDRAVTMKSGRQSTAFNDMAEQLRRSRERLVYLTQMSSWQSLARKTAHELKNSLTPIRLTVEEMLARQPQADRAFMDAGRADRRERNRDARAARPRVLRVRQRAAGQPGGVRSQRARSPSAWRC